MNKFTILGCGSSLGSPWITNYSAKLKKNSKNIRTRCCAHIQKDNLSILIDTSPDIKSQFLNNKIRSLDAIIYTHEHADQTSGIFEMRPFFWKNKKKIPVYASSRTIKELKDKYTFCFSQRHGYKPIMKANTIKKKFLIKKDNTQLFVDSFEVVARAQQVLATLANCLPIPFSPLAPGGGSSEWCPAFESPHRVGNYCLVDMHLG